LAVICSLYFLVNYYLPLKTALCCFHIWELILIKVISILIMLVISGSVISAELQSPQEYIITSSSSQNVKLYVFEPPLSKRTGSSIITVHGGGWKWGSAEWTFERARAFANAGMLAVAVDYRLSSDEITPVDALQDVCDALFWIRKRSDVYSLDPNKVAAYGVSAGGQLSSIAAAKGCNNKLGSMKNGGPDLLVLWSPALDMENDGWFKKLLQGKSLVIDSSPLANVNEDMPPISIVQGELDTLTTTNAAVKFCEARKDKKDVCEINIYPGVGHLLTRNLEHQESNFDPDPAFVKLGKESIMKFLVKNQFVKGHVKSH
jgi:acetyl esterase/lipase